MNQVMLPACLITKGILYQKLAF